MNEHPTAVGRVLALGVVAVFTSGACVLARATYHDDPVLIVAGVAVVAGAVGFAILHDAYTSLLTSAIEQKAEWAEILAHATRSATAAPPAGTPAPSRPALFPCSAHPAVPPLAFELDPDEDLIQSSPAQWRVWAPPARVLPLGTPVLISFRGDPHPDPIRMAVVGYDPDGYPHVGLAA